MAVGLSQTDTGAWVNGMPPTSGLENSVLMSVATADVPPDSLVYGRTVAINDPLTWSATAARDGGGTGEVSVDTEGLVTITPNVLNIKTYGTFAVIFSFKGGANETKYIVHNNAQDIIDTHITSFPQETSGHSTIPTPHAADSLIYYVNPDYVGGGAPKGYLIGDTEVNGAWQNPLGAIIPYASLRDCPTERLGKADYYLILRGTEDRWVGGSGITLVNDAKSATERHVFSWYGDIADPRPIINIDGDATYPNVFSAGTTEDNFFFSGLEITSTEYNPDHIDFIGWDNVEATAAFSFYAGAAGTDVARGYLVEDCYMHHLGEGISVWGDGMTRDVIVRWNVFAWLYDGFARAQGWWIGNGSALGEHNVFYHCGWYQNRVQINGTAASGSTTTMVSNTPGEFAGMDLVTLRIKDSDGSSYGRITSHDDDSVIFTVISGDVDFTGGGAFEIGLDKEQGQATPENHSRYWSRVTNTVSRYNISIRPSSMHHKLTADVTGPPASVPLTGATNANPCVMSLVGHGYITDDWVKFEDFTGDWSGINGSRDSPLGFYQVTYIDDDNFSVQGLDTSAFSAFTVGSVRDYTDAYNEEKFGPEHTDNFCLYDELFIEGEIGYSIGGNRDNSLGTRFKDMQVSGTVMYKIGIDSPTNRVLGWAMSATDWNGGICSDLLILDAGSATFDNPRGITFGGFANDVVLSRNSVLNMEGDTSDDFRGLMSFNQNDPYEAWSNVYSIGNLLQTDSVNISPVANLNTTDAAEITFQDNIYWSALSSANWFGIDGTLSNSTAWEAASGETGATYTLQTLIDDTRNVETYMAEQGKTASIDALYSELLLRKYGTVDPAFTAPAINAWIKYGHRVA